MSARLWRFKRIPSKGSDAGIVSGDVIRRDGQLPSPQLPAPYLACFEIRGSDNLNVRLLAAAPANEVGEPLGVMQIVGQKIELLAFHLAAKLAKNASHIEFEKDPRVAAGQIADATHCAIVPALVQASTTTAERFFERQVRVMMRALRSPKIPRTVPSGRKPGKAYASHNLRRRFAGAVIQLAPDFEHASTCSKPCSDAALRRVNA